MLSSAQKNETIKESSSRISGAPPSLQEAEKSTNKDIYSVEIQNDGSHMKVFMPLHMHQEMAFINEKQQPSKRPRTANGQEKKITSERETALNADNGDTKQETLVDETVEIPESTRQYERQLRKIQAATRASTTVSSDDLEIVHNDPHIVVVNKPSGFLTVPGVNNNPNLLSLVYETLQERDEDDRKILQQLEKMEHMIVHRLDMDTSGLVIFAKTKESMAQLQASFRHGTDQANHQSKKKRRKNRKKQSRQDGDGSTTGGLPPVTKPIQKEYEALLCGHLLPPNLKTIHIDLPLQRDHQHPPFMRVATPTSELEAKDVVKGLNHAGWKKIVKKNAKPSQTMLHVLRREYVVKKGNHNGATTSTDSGNSSPSIEERLPVTRVRLVPITGRTHQLRVHCAAIGHPIFADPTYGILGEAAPNGGFDTSLVDKAFQEVNSASRTSMKLQLELDQWVKDHQQVMCLHARKLQLNHPVTGAPLYLEATPKFACTLR